VLLESVVRASYLIEDYLVLPDYKRFTTGLGSEGISRISKFKSKSKLGQNLTAQEIRWR
jgi:hypothetical protein